MIGYARVSSTNQNEDRQVIDMIEYGVPQKNIYVYKEIQEEWKRITHKKGADIIVLDMPLLDTTKSKDLLGTFIADLVLQLLSFVAENERINIRQRQAEGIAAAKKRGVRFGRPPMPIPDNFEQNYRLWKDKKITAQQGADNCKLPLWAFYKFGRNINQK